MYLLVRVSVPYTLSAYQQYMCLRVYIVYTCVREYVPIIYTVHVYVPI